MRALACSQKLSLQAPHESDDQSDFCLGYPTEFSAKRPPRQASSRLGGDTYASWSRKSALAASLDRLIFLSYIDSMSTVEVLSDDKLELLKGTLEVLILRSLKRGPNHAYGISQFLQQ